MSFTNPAPIGGYATGDLIDESQINYWCAALPDCIDGSGGGSYTLSAPLVFGAGDYIQFDNDVYINGLASFGAASFTGDVTIGNSSSDIFHCVASATFDNDVTLGATSADTISLHGVMGPAGNGRVLQTGINVASASQSVSGTQYRYIVITYGTTTTTTITGTFVDGDMIRFYNASGVSQTIAGSPLAGSIPSGVSITRLLISGTWTTVGD